MFICWNLFQFLSIHFFLSEIALLIGIACFIFLIFFLLSFFLQFFFVYFLWKCQMIGCSHRCKFVGCGNPYGSSQAAKQAYTHVTTSRYRPKQKQQEVREHLQSWLSDESRFNSSIWMVRDWKSYIRLSCELRIFEGLSTEPSRVYEYYSKLHDISKKSWESLATKESYANRWETPKHQESGWRLWSALQKAGWTELVLIGQTLLDTVSTT